MRGDKARDFATQLRIPEQVRLCSFPMHDGKCHKAGMLFTASIITSSCKRCSK